MSKPDPRAAAEAVARVRLRRVLGEAGLARYADDAVLVRLGPNATFRVGADLEILARIADPGKLAEGAAKTVGLDRWFAERAAKTVRLGRWFAEVDAPTIRLAPGYSAPILFTEDDKVLAASLWQYVQPVDRAVTGEEMAAALKEFHSLSGRLPEDRLELPTFNAFNDIEARLKRAGEKGSITETDFDFLMDRSAGLRMELANSSVKGDLDLCHGDAQMNNLIIGQNGRALWCDFDATELGSFKYDLACIATAHNRFGESKDDPTPFNTAYGFDIVSDEAVQVLAKIRELKTISAAPPRFPQHPAIHE
ncbi:MAG: phosphotransferase family protein, partial [Terriglobales bacterium]